LSGGKWVRGSKIKDGVEGGLAVPKDREGGKTRGG